MSRTPSFARFARAIRIARYCEHAGIPTAEGLARAAAADARGAERRRTRREFLADVGKLTVAGALASVTPAWSAAARNLDVGIVGAGLAGLACADELLRLRVSPAPTIYEASDRVGGRCFSLGGAFPGAVTFPGQVVERGGEFIDTLHKTMLGYAQRFDLEIEDVTKQPGDVFYFLAGVSRDESEVVDEFRAFVAAMRDDLRSLSGDVTAEDHVEPGPDVDLDNTSLLDYLVTRGAGPIVKAAIIEAYEAEFGLEADAMSCLNFLLFIHADKRSKFTPFGIFSDERWHVRHGNQQIAEGLAAAIQAAGSAIDFGMRLARVRKTPSRQIELTFQSGRKTVTRTHDAAVLTIPFTVLRQVELDPNLAIPANQLNAIQTLGYGTNAKTMVGFTSRFWIPLGCTGATYSDRSHHQATWETNPVNATATDAVLTDYASGPRGATLGNVHTEVGRFLDDLERLLPGAIAAAKKTKGKFLAHQEVWTRNPLTLGSYTCYTPGQFTTVAGLEGARRQPLLCRRAHELVLRLSGLHGGRRPLRARRRRRHPCVAAKSGRPVRRGRGR